ncbi:glycosyltransferase [Streptomyces palmae]|uniref:Glycosyltransferase n=1 Tax=Streptomyces palmae TaxID=1701085 RepID=A0A4Z0GIH9_9ACTN|nr:glycosyltransferase [Streptomyces palmae]TGA96562.1 glycosyltransferase [Streptomyces palmae]
MSEQSSIPELIHQAWVDADVPARWQNWVDSWRRRHPGWEYRLWTDAESRSFLEEHYPWFLPIYDGYPNPVMRADVIRYFLVDHFGGVYADLDVECLRPTGELLSGRRLVLGCEPPAHTRLPSARRRGLRRIVGNAFIASAPGHPLWAHVHRELVGAHTLTDALDVSGPFFLTRALENAPEDGSITVVGPELLYPKVNPVAARLFGPPEIDQDRAFAVHHGAGSWSAEESWAPRPSQHTRVRFWTSQGLRPLADGAFDLEAQRLRWASGAPAPTVSCLMVTKDRPALAERAIRCFLAQTYQEKELVVVDDSRDDTLERHVRGLGDPRIRFHRLPPDGQTLGALRNIAVDRATGAYVCQWDDDDLCDPERVEVQMAAVLAVGAEACFLARERLWRPARRELAVSHLRVWEGTMLCAKSALPRYPEQRRGEDTPVAAHVVSNSRVVSVDVPELYTYVCHENNTFEPAHFQRIFDVAPQVWTGGDYVEQLLAMAARLPIDPADLAAAATDAASDAPAATEAASDVPVRVEAASDVPTQADVTYDAPAEAETVSGVRTDAGPGTDAGAGSGADDLRTHRARWVVSEPAPAPVADRPSVLVLTPVKDAARFLPGYFDNLRGLDYPHEAISLGLLEGDSQDETWDVLQRALPELERRYRRVTLVRHHAGVRLPGQRWEPGVQRERRAALARVRNHLLSRALSDEQWVLWVDVDVTSYPPDLVQRLLAARKDIVVPHCVSEPNGPSFDLNTFLLRPDARALNWSQWIRDGILQPPRGFGRAHLDELGGHELVRIDSVGGTVLLVRADLHRAGLVFPPVPYRHLIETEGLAALAKDMGTTCWALPGLEVVHPHHWSEPAGRPAVPTV